MRWLSLLAILSTTVWASPIITAPIHVSGGGFYDAEPLGYYGGWELRISFSGTNGADSISLSADGGFDMGGSTILPDPITNIVTFIGVTNGCSEPLFGHCYVGSATIDGITGDLPDYGGNVASFSFASGGASFVEITDRTGALLAEADIVGYLDVTSETTTYGPFPPLGITYGLLETYYTFNILPTPEPGSIMLVVICAGLLAARRRASSAARCGTPNTRKGTPSNSTQM
jgi:hypothetical protein